MTVDQGVIGAASAMFGIDRRGPRDVRRRLARGDDSGAPLALFGLAVVCALCAIVAFTVEVLLAGTGIRAEVALSRRSAAEDAAGESQEPQQSGADGAEANAESGS